MGEDLPRTQSLSARCRRWVLFASARSFRHSPAPATSAKGKHRGVHSAGPVPVEMCTSIANLGNLPLPRRIGTAQAPRHCTAPHRHQTDTDDARHRTEPYTTHEPDIAIYCTKHHTRHGFGIFVRRKVRPFWLLALKKTTRANTQ